ncbi:methyltransferase, FxLD system [Streptomyces megasporus]|uniref:methyltransferase, FxLD system n=1 Tax=Streptomyces megasporus TaxID=44060 RepID=UPI0004E0E9AF|nr:methyltransferase, FxLD system [Streptomyces megasporus]
MTTTAPDELADRLRDRMLDLIRDAGRTPSPRVTDALRTIPRHRYVPDAPLENAYADEAVITKRAAGGESLSCASMPSLVAAMLDWLDVQPGHRILEIGAGTGYNAALLAHLAGPGGQVVTIDIDPEVTAQARRALDATGHERVRVITRDGSLGAPEHGPYDRIVFTVGAWDIPRAIQDQLAPGGRLVVPLRWRGTTRCLALVKEEDGRLRADSAELCGFVPMLGPDQDGERSAPIDADGRATLYWDTDQAIDPQSLAGVLERPRTTTWSGVVVGPMEPFDGVWLRLAGTEPGTCRIAADPAAVGGGLCTPAIPARSPALVEGDSLAYFALTPLDRDGDDRRWELGAIGHGPAGPDLVDRLCEQIHAWNADRDATPAVAVHPADTPDEEIATGAFVITKRSTRLALTW